MFLTSLPNVACLEESESSVAPPTVAVLFTDESPYSSGGSIRITLYVANNILQPIQIYIDYEIRGLDESNDHIVISKTTRSFTIHSGYVQTANWGKPLPQHTPSGMYEWDGTLYYRIAGSGDPFEPVDIDNCPIFFTVG